MAHWTTNPDDRRVKAALKVKCEDCGARPNRECGWWRGKRGQEVFTPLATGLVHEIRVPKSVLHRR